MTIEQFNNSKIVFFGSTSDSLIVLKKLFEAKLTIAAVVTQPPRPIGRKQILTPTPTESWAKEHSITLLSFPTNKENPILYENEDAVINTLSTFDADLLVSASYGEKIPTKTISDATYGGLNVHPSLLPRWRGADPIPWAILSGDHQTGATVVTLTEQMDEGKIIAQKKIPITPDDSHIPLREKLFGLGADLLVEILPDYFQGTIDGHPQNPKEAIFARRLKREDGYIPWHTIEDAMIGEQIKKEDLPLFLQQILSTSSSNSELSTLVDRAIRALSPWPGVWTEIEVRSQKPEERREKKRLKILEGHSEQHDGKQLLVLETVQIEGKTPTPFRQLMEQFRN